MVLDELDKVKMIEELIFLVKDDKKYLLIQIIQIFCVSKIQYFI